MTLDEDGPYGLYAVLGAGAGGGEKEACWTDGRRPGWPAGIGNGLSSMVFRDVLEGIGRE